MRSLAMLLSSTMLVTASALAQEGTVTDRTIQTHVYEPKPIEPTEAEIAKLELPPGFELSVYARDLGNPRIISSAGEGRVYVTRRESGDLLLLEDTDRDGAADRRRIVAARPQLHGIAIDGDEMWLITVEDIYRTTINADGSLAPLQRIVDDLPAGGQHPNRTLAKGPDGMLYVSVGSTCNACDETDPQHATMLRMRPDGSEREIFASGLRNTIGFAWHPETQELWGLDHGIDWLGNDDQPEELNRITWRSKYGWPYIYADGRENPQDEPPAEISVEAWRRASTSPVLTYTAHSAPMQMTFGTAGSLPDEYDGDAFATMRGSWNRKPPSGYEVVRIDFEDGKPVAIEPFLSGFVREEGGGHGYLARPVGLAMTEDGSMLVGDDSNGIIYRVRWTGERSVETAGAATGTDNEGRDSGASVGQPAVEPSSPAALQPGHGPSTLAMTAVQPTSSERLQVSSTSFGDGEAIPALHGQDGHRASPPLTWSGGPEGTRSYALLVEDPDAKSPTPFVHWLAYDVPGTVTSLPESIAALPKVREPVALLQGANSFGSTGWYGPKAEDVGGAHRYHVQVFALDQTLGLPPGANREEVLAAMDGHVLSVGELIGTFGGG